MTVEPLSVRAAAAVRLVQELPSRRPVLVVADADTDGVAAAAVLARAFAATGHRFRIRLTRRRDAALLDELAAAEPAILVTADLGASLVPRLLALRIPAIVLDHHEPAGDGDGETLVHVNPHLVGEDGSTTASGAAVSFVFAEALLEASGQDAGDLLPFAVLGAWGDRYHGAQAGTGLHARIAARAAVALPQQSWSPTSDAAHPLADALAGMLDPVVPQLVADPDAARAALARIGLDPDAAPDALDEDAHARLASWLVATLVAGGAEPHLAVATLAPRPVFPPGTAPYAGVDVATLARSVDAAARRGAATTALAALLGSNDAYAVLQRDLRVYRDAVLAPVARVARQNTEAVALGPAHLVRGPDGRYAGPIADRLMAWTALGTAPVVVLGPVGRGVKASLRARRGGATLPAWRLDAAAAVAARVAGGTGGGHRLAAGAVFPAEKEALFLERLATELGRGGTSDTATIHTAAQGGTS